MLKTKIWTESSFKRKILGVLNGQIKCGHNLYHFQNHVVKTSKAGLTRLTASLSTENVQNKTKSTSTTATTMKTANTFTRYPAQPNPTAKTVTSSYFSHSPV